MRRSDGQPAPRDVRAAPLARWLAALTLELYDERARNRDLHDAIARRCDQLERTQQNSAQRSAYDLRDLAERLTRSRTESVGRADRGLP